MRTSNPALGASTFTRFGSQESSSATMTVQGTVNRTAFLLLLLVCAAAFTWRMVGSATSMGEVFPWMIGGLIAGLILAVITMVKKDWAMFTGPLYAVAEGLFIGAISALFETKYPGIVPQAAGITFGVLFALLAVYKLRIIKVTENFRLGITAATGGIFLVYLATMILRLFGVPVPYIHGAGIVGIGFSLFVVVIASLNLVPISTSLKKARNTKPRSTWNGTALSAFL
jgi:uncharacterized YccA/Bax inhibitor family protein